MLYVLVLEQSVGLLQFVYRRVYFLKYPQCSHHTYALDGSVVESLRLGDDRLFSLITPEGFSCNWLYFGLPTSFALVEWLSVRTN